MNKNKLDTREIIQTLTRDTQEVINEFLKHYKSISHNAYRSAICNLFYLLGKQDVKELDITDRNKNKEILENKGNQSANYKYCEAFFQYIYAFDIIKNPNGFDEIWIKKDQIARFNKLLKRLENNENKQFKPKLSLIQINKIEELLSLDYKDNPKMLRMSFYWYLIFETECSVEEIKKMKATDYDYKTHILKSESGNEYYVPDKYIPIFDYLKDRTYSGFRNVNELINDLGKIAGIGKLTPIIIKQARNENTLRCSMCGNQYSNSKENWISINNRIICYKCAEEIKKKNNVIENEIDSVSISTNYVQENIKIHSIVYTFDKLKSQLNSSIDYLSLHKFLIEIGNLGEAFVLDLERMKLKGTEYEEYVSNMPALDASNGYDILSYDLEGNKIYIEVKTELGEENDFYMSDHELSIAKKFKKEDKKYIVYRVSNILAEKKSDIKYEIIEDITENNSYKFNVYNWRVTKVKNNAKNVIEEL